MDPAASKLSLTFAVSKDLQAEYLLTCTNETTEVASIIIFDVQLEN